MEVSQIDSCAYRYIDWLERADGVGQDWGSRPYEPTILNLLPF